MKSLFQEVLSLLWIYVKQKDVAVSSINEETLLFFEEKKPHLPMKRASSLEPQEKAARKPSSNTFSSPQVEPPLPKTHQITQQKKVEASLEKSPAPPLISSEQETTKLIEDDNQHLQHDQHKLLPKAFTFLNIDTFETRKKIQALPSQPRLRDGCLYETPEKKIAAWALFSFPLPPQEENFLNSIIHAIEERLQKKVFRFSCHDTTFGENLTLSALDSEKLFFFIEPHNDSTLKKLLENIPAFSKTLHKEVHPFLSLGSIHGNPLHLFYVSPTASASTEVKSHLWLGLKQLAFGMKTP